MRPAAAGRDRCCMRTIMSADGTQAAANGTRPARIMIIDDHEITRAACRALLRTEGADVVADMAAGDQAIAAAAALRPDEVVGDASPSPDAGLAVAQPPAPR